VGKNSLISQIKFLCQTQVSYGEKNLKKIFPISSYLSSVLFSNPNHGCPFFPSWFRQLGKTETPDIFHRQYGRTSGVTYKHVNMILPDFTKLPDL